MDFTQVVGQNHLKSHLIKSIENGRIPHAQLFVGTTGSGILPMAIAYSQAILCSNHEINTPAYVSCKNKVEQLVHPDLHFVYPVSTTDTVKRSAVSSNFIQEWRNFVAENPYNSLYQWHEAIGIEKKQGSIKVDEAKEMLKTLSLKAYEGGYKIIIVWMADRMNTECSNKILKLVEEPPEKTILLLLAEEEEKIIGTIRSRCQKLQFPLLSEEHIAANLIQNKNTDSNKALKISKQANGDYNNALHLLAEDGNYIIFEKWFVSWVRTAFRAKGNKTAIRGLIKWSEDLAKEGRETQKKFLAYCSETFRQALLKNYKADHLLFFEAEDTGFTIEKFAPFIHQNNIYEIQDAVEDASYHIERNGNAKIIFTDLSIKLTRLIHAKP